MINAAIVGSSLGSAMKYAAPALKELGFDPQHFMREVMQQLSGQGIPGAAGMLETQINPSVGSAPTFSGLQNSGLGNSLA
jgi:hypothetical protein